MMMMFEEDDQECLQIYDRVLEYMEKVRICDDVEARQITGKAFTYLMQCSFDDMGTACNEARKGFIDLTNKISAAFTRRIKS